MPLRAACLLSLVLVGCVVLPKSRRAKEEERRECALAESRRARDVAGAAEEIRAAVKGAMAPPKGPPALLREPAPGLDRLLTIKVDSMERWSCRDPARPIEEVPFHVEIGEPWLSSYAVRATPPVLDLSLAELRRAGGGAPPIAVEVVGRRIQRPRFGNRHIRNEHLAVTLIDSDCSQLSYALNNLTTRFVKVRTVSLHLGGTIGSFTFDVPVPLPPTASKPLRFRLVPAHRSALCREVGAEAIAGSIVLGVSVEYAVDDVARSLHGSETFPVAQLL
jgi:hypothetical protein